MCDEKNSAVINPRASECGTFKARNHARKREREKERGRDRENASLTSKEFLDFASRKRVAIDRGDLSTIATCVELLAASDAPGRVCKFTRVQKVAASSAAAAADRRVFTAVHYNKTDGNSAGE